MTDIADEAQLHEMRERDICIRETLDRMRPTVPQVVIPGEDGAPTIVCYDCLCPIPLARLEKMPHAIRCVGCQEAHELEAACTTKEKPHGRPRSHPAAGRN